VRSSVQIRAPRFSSSHGPGARHSAASASGRR